MTSFKPITSADVENLMPIETACHSHPWSDKTFNSCIGGRYFGFYLIEEGEPIGFYIGEHVVGEVTLMDICVTPSLQGNGHGKRLLEHFLAETKAIEASKVWLEVRAKNISAQMMYINKGFTETSRRTGYYPSAKGFGYEDAIVMRLSL